MTQRQTLTNTVQQEKKQVGICYGVGTEHVIRIYPDTDTCEVIQSGSAEPDSGYGISERASELFRNYAIRGYVHEDDLEAYLLFTERHAMQEWPVSGSEKKILNFRRKTGQEFRGASLEILPDEGFSGEHPSVLAVLRDL
jgi:hypothetical protein